MDVYNFFLRLEVILNKEDKDFFLFLYYLKVYK